MGLAAQFQCEAGKCHTEVLAHHQDLSPTADNHVAFTRPVNVWKLSLAIAAQLKDWEQSSCLVQLSTMSRDFEHLTFNTVPWTKKHFQDHGHNSRQLVFESIVQR